MTICTRHKTGCRRPSSRPLTRRLRAMTSTLATAKETGRRLGLGYHTRPTKVLKDGSEVGGKHASLDEVALDADGFAVVFPSTSTRSPSAFRFSPLGRYDWGRC
ncbi:uncharacterized protein B0H18DRAFT_247807 [Fomitopsis serialis]|uniref:uncharacterized protein n=1 Tax=Fomitopsis serialis TaxID=139415 RepID=UPI0020072368|nr:uncharacterized protein B0H18DRAFT_247807 [Neoantrodia serialis]KAH9912557.1 hypothetical protein B0H18DRAFT_247807 [Neoantrodia serialis]